MWVWKKTMFSNTLFIGKKILRLASCASTNDFAAEVLSQNPHENGTLIITESQTQGRGQRGNIWEAESGKNLTFSVIFQPDSLLASDHFRLNMAVCLAIYDFLILFLEKNKVKIKWSNDIYFEDRKLGGVLIENTISEQKIRHSIIGIGLNINQLSFENPKAVSLTTLTNTAYNLENLLEKLGENLEKRILQIRQQNATLRAEYLQNLYWYQETHFFRIGNQEISGQILGIDQTGNLALQINQKIRYFSFKEIVFIK